MTSIVCAGCGCKILDKYYLMAIDRQWHGSCLRCSTCGLLLESKLTCFSRNGKIYCKDDYNRLYCNGVCARCKNEITAYEIVMRARDFVFHLSCFCCFSCGQRLQKGDLYGIIDGMVYCRSHLDALYISEFIEDDNRYSDVHSDCESDNTNQPLKYKIRIPKKIKLFDFVKNSTSTSLDVIHYKDFPDQLECFTYNAAINSTKNRIHRTKRIRTSFKHHQLRSMKSYFAINQNPDAKDLKQLAQKTGLSKRVLQVWFQNARAKWRRSAMRHEGRQLTTILSNMQRPANTLHVLPFPASAMDVDVTSTMTLAKLSNLYQGT